MNGLTLPIRLSFQHFLHIFNMDSKSPDQANKPTVIQVEPQSPRYTIPSNASAIRKIAIPVDLSDESAYAVSWAVQNYLRQGDAVTLIHVRPTSVLYGADWGSTHFVPDANNTKLKDDEFDSLTAGKIAEIAQPLVDAKIGFKVHVVKDHDMKERLCLEIERLGMSAVIMGSRGFGASRLRDAKGRLGSVSDYCVHHCVCPVVVVRYPDDNDAAAAAAGGSLHSVPEEEASDISKLHLHAD